MALSPEYYAKNREKILQQRRAWANNNWEAVEKQSKRYYDKHFLKHLLRAAKRRALVSDLEFTIGLQDLVVPELCPILKVPLILRTRYAPSIDRKDNSKGYTKDNVWIISRRANSMKNDATPEDIKAFGEWINNGGYNF